MYNDELSQTSIIFTVGELVTWHLLFYAGEIDALLSLKARNSNCLLFCSYTATLADNNKYATSSLKQ